MEREGSDPSSSKTVGTNFSVPRGDSVNTAPRGIAIVARAIKSPINLIDEPLKLIGSARSIWLELSGFCVKVVFSSSIPEGVFETGSRSIKERVINSPEEKKNPFSLKLLKGQISLYLFKLLSFCH